MERILSINKTFLVVLSLALGIIGAFIPEVIKFGTLALIAYALYDVYQNQNQNEEAFLWASFFAGVEVFIRMCRATIFYETGKYAVLFLLFFGLLLNRKKYNFSFTFYLYIFLLFIGIVFTNIPPGESIRKAVTFNLSGPIVLGIAAMYFYKREVYFKDLLTALYLMLLPLISILSFLYFRTPSIEEMVFGTSANFAATAGFGPNQVSTVMGLGIFIVTVFVILKVKIINYLTIDLLLLVYFVFRGLLTFSRGGMITGLVAIIIFTFFYIVYQEKSFNYVIKYLLVGGVFAFSIWLYTSNVTGGMIENRYAGKNARGIKKEDISSGRIGIFKTQLENFYENPIFGIGVGSGKYARIEDHNGIASASHNEVSRLLEEHGSIGILILLILFIEPITNMYYSNNFQRAFLIPFFLFWFLTINHSAMRIAFPGFIYALSLIRIVNEEG